MHHHMCTWKTVTHDTPQKNTHDRVTIRDQAMSSLLDPWPLCFLLVWPLWSIRLARCGAVRLYSCSLNLQRLLPQYKAGEPPWRSIRKLTGYHPQSKLVDHVQQNPSWDWANAVWVPWDDPWYKRVKGVDKICASQNGLTSGIYQHRIMA